MIGWTKSILGRRAAPAAVMSVCMVLYPLARLPALSEHEVERLAAPFRFAEVSVGPEADGATSARRVRAVNPSIRHIESWISSVGAAVALSDIDGDGLTNDYCLVDPRTDAVTVGPIAGTRFKPFSLTVDHAPYAAATVAPMGCLPGDVNEDGRTDVLVYYWGRPPVLFLNVGRGHAEEPAFQPVAIAAGDGPWFSNAATFADVDGDGHPDLIVGNYFAEDAAVLDARATRPTKMHSSMSRAENGGKNRLFLWTGDAATSFFKDSSDALPSRSRRAWTLAIGAADIDGDLRPELYFANDFGSDHLLHNLSHPGRPRFAIVEGRRKFTTPRSKVLGQDSFKGMGVDFGDLNGDGRIDIFVSNIAQEYALEESHFAFLNTGDASALARGIAPFTDESEKLGLSRSGWAWDAKLVDLNNDGVTEIIQATGFVDGSPDRWPELHEIAMGNDILLRHPGAWPRISRKDGLAGQQPNFLFVRDSDGIYRDVARRTGIGDAVAARGIATADIDGDGRQDFCVANQWAPSKCYLNRAPAAGGFLGLDLRYATAASEAGRPAVGAQAVVTMPGSRHLTAQVDGGNGHSGKRAPILHFGLGDHPRDVPVRVSIAWRDVTGLHRRVLMLLPGHHRVDLRDGRAIAPDASRRNLS